MSTNLNVNPHVGVEQHLASFEVVADGIQSLGLNKRNKECYLIKVKFEDGKFAAFQTQSKSLKTAFEMIEVIGQQTKGLTSDEFQKYMKSNLGKRMWFNMTNTSKNPKFKNDEVVAYKADRHGSSLKYAFSTDKNAGFKPALTINNAILDDLKRIAKFHQTQLDQSANLANKDMRVVLRKRSRSQ